MIKYHWVFECLENAPTRTIFLIKVPTNTSPPKNLLRHYAKQAFNHSVFLIVEALIEPMLNSHSSKASRYKIGMLVCKVQWVVWLAQILKAAWQLQFLWKSLPISCLLSQSILTTSNKQFGYERSLKQLVMSQFHVFLPCCPFSIVS